MLALTTMSEISHKASFASGNLEYRVILSENHINYTFMVHLCHFWSLTALSNSLLLLKQFSQQSHLDFCVPYTIFSKLFQTITTVPFHC